MTDTETGLLADALRGWAPGVEGYPGLVVHGPLLALLALELPRRHAPGPVIAFSYRLVRPACAGAVVEATGRFDHAVWTLAVGTADGGCLTATATLGEGQR